jgi:hypothetical protein
VLARALGWPALISIRGAGAHSGLPIAPRAGAGATLDAARPAVVVLDDPTARHARAWLTAAARRRIPVVSLHDVGLARVPSTLAIDGSVVSPASGWPAEQVLRGLDYAVIAPPARRRSARGVRRVLVSLGGGPRAELTMAIVERLQERHPGVEFYVTQRGPDGARANDGRRVRVIRTTSGLGPWFGRVDMAVVGGGVSLYEAVAAGVPTIAVPVVPAQRPTIRGFETLQVTVSGVPARASRTRLVAQVAARFDTMVADAAWRRRVQQLGPQLVDGQGAQRVARAIAAVSQGVTRG